MCCALVVGVGLWGGMAKKFNAADELSYEPNVACVKGSPYGKVLGLAMQGPIDFYWHKGKTHEDAVILKDSSNKHQHGEDCGCDAHANNQPVDKKSDPICTRAKQQIKRMVANTHRQTNGQPLSPQHEKYLQGVTEDKLKLAYELDPSNYTNYGNYHLFIATTTFGKDDFDDHKAVELAKKTLEFCKRDSVDPASWITAASAAYNIVFHIGRYHNQFTIAEAKTSLVDFDFCISEYQRLRGEAFEEGHIISEDRLAEMNERARFLSKLRAAQGVYMKRMMSTKMAPGRDSIQKVN